LVPTLELLTTNLQATPNFYFNTGDSLRKAVQVALIIQKIV
jgi:hypothetical protein